MAKEKVTNWEDDKVTIKVVNIESPGSDISVNINGKSFLMQHEATVVVPRAVLNVLKDTKIKNVEVEGDLEKGNTVKVKSVSERFFVVELPMAEKKDESVLDNISDNKNIK